MNALSSAIAKEPNGFMLVRYWNRSFSPTRRQDTRHTLRQQSCFTPKGRGNKAWKRADRLEREWRASGGFYVSDFIPIGRPSGNVSNAAREGNATLKPWLGKL